MLKRRRAAITVAVILFAAFLIGLYGFSVGSSYKESIVVAYQNFYQDIMEYVGQLIEFLRESLGVKIQL